MAIKERTPLSTFEFPTFQPRTKEEMMLMRQSIGGRGGLSIQPILEEKPSMRTVPARRGAPEQNQMQSMFDLPSYDKKTIFDVNAQPSGFNPNLKMNAETLMKEPFMETISIKTQEEGKKPKKERGAFYKGLERLGGEGGVNQGLKEFASIISDAFFGDRGVQAGIEARELARAEAQPDAIDAGEFIRLQEAQVLQALQAAPGKTIKEKLDSLNPYQRDVYKNYIKRTDGSILETIFELSTNDGKSTDSSELANKLVDKYTGQNITS